MLKKTSRETIVLIYIELLGKESLILLECKSLRNYSSPMWKLQTARQATAGISTAPIFYQFELNISVDNGGPAVTGFLSHQKKNATDGLGRLC